MLLHRRRRRPTPSSTPPQHIRPLPDFATLPRVGWRWERWKTADENWLDLAYLVARASEAKDGHMGCCIVRDPHGREPSLISTTINCGIYGRYRSDLHAEAAAVSDCARRGEKLEGCTLYVTRAPCPRCHCLIAAAGIRRVVAPTDLETEACVVSAEEFGIEMVKLRDAPPRKAWRDGLAEKHRDNGDTSGTPHAKEAEEGQDLRQERSRRRRQNPSIRRATSLPGRASRRRRAPALRWRRRRLGLGRRTNVAFLAQASSCSAAAAARTRAAYPLRCGLRTYQIRTSGLLS